MLSLISSHVKYAKVKLYYVLCLAHCYVTDDSSDEIMNNKECRYCPIQPIDLDIALLTEVMMDRAKNNRRESTEYTKCKQAFREVRNVIITSEFNEDFQSIDNSIMSACHEFKNCYYFILR